MRTLETMSDIVDGTNAQFQPTLASNSACYGMDVQDAQHETSSTRLARISMSCSAGIRLHGLEKHLQSTRNEHMGAQQQALQAMGNLLRWHGSSHLGHIRGLILFGQAFVIH